MKPALACLVALLVFTSRNAAAHPAHLKDAKSSYWIGHSVGTGALAVSTLITGIIEDDHPTIRHPTSLALSRATLTLELLGPLPMTAASTNSVEFANFSLVYAQSLLLAKTLNNALRPLDLDSSSFVAFAGAYASAATLDRQRKGLTAPRTTLPTIVPDFAWGFQLGLAGISSSLEVHSGRATLWGALTGGLVGTAVGIGVQAAHGEDWKRGPTENWGYGLLGLVPCAALSFTLLATDADDITWAWLRDLRLSPLASSTASGVSVSTTF